MNLLNLCDMEDGILNPHPFTYPNESKTNYAELVASFSSDGVHWHNKKQWTPYAENE